VGVQTNIKEGSTPFLVTMDWIIWVAFAIECVLKTIACKFHPGRFYYDRNHGGMQGWNCFDETIVILSFPLVSIGSFVMVLRLLRLLRVLKLLRALPHLQVRTRQTTPTRSRSPRSRAFCAAPGDCLFTSISLSLSLSLSLPPQPAPR
jgi:hypothetical protein